MNITEQTGHLRFTHPKRGAQYRLHPVLESERIGLVSGVYDSFHFFVSDSLNFPKEWHPRKVSSKIRDLFTNWLISNITYNNTDSDPMIPQKSNLDVNSKSSLQLVVDMANIIMKGGTSKAKAITKSKNICSSLYSSIGDTIDDYHRKIGELEGTIDDSDMNVVTEKIPGSKISISFRGLEKIIINSSFIDRLRILWNSSNPMIMIDDTKFFTVVYMLFARYTALDRRFIRQGGLTKGFFKDLYMEFGINFEMFAGSTNTNSNGYCSLFPDIERFFGSKGNFFDFNPISGFYQCNPPLIEVITDESISLISEWLENSSEPLSFILFTPPWEGEDDSSVYDYKGVKHLEEKDQITYTFSPDKTEFINYISLHSNTITVFRSPRITVAQNEAGKKKWPVDESMMKIIKNHIFSK